MKKPSWRKQGDIGPESGISSCDPFLLMTALRGLAPILNDIANSERICYPDSAQDIEFVACKLDRLVTELHNRLIVSGKLASKPPQKSNHSGGSDASRPKAKRRKRLADGTLGFTNNGVFDDEH